MDAKYVFPFQKYNHQITVKFSIVIDNKYRTTHRCGEHFLKLSFPELLMFASNSLGNFALCWIVGTITDFV